jgi:hypothetical protein
MTDQEVEELAVILVLEHGDTALNVAENRRSLHAPGSDSFELWTRITEAVGRLIGVSQPARVDGARH